MFLMDVRNGYLRIGELARRTGVSPELLRAWEQRYRLLEPARSEGGFRLYSDLDEQRVRSMTASIGRGLSASEAAKEVLAGGSPSVMPPAAAPAPVVDELRIEIQAALDAMDTDAAHAVLDRALGALSVHAVLSDLVLPFLRELGDRWAAGEISVAQEHFASSLIRGRLMGIARDWGSGNGPVAVLACPPGEAHELGLIVFGIELARRGWRITYLGADTPVSTMVEAARAARPALVVLAVTDVEAARAHASEVRSLAAEAPLALGGSVLPEDARLFDARVLDGDPLEAARAVADSVGVPGPTLG
jgi:MerR family transcriptional regulator, light-induced transcriptional regulator